MADFALIHESDVLPVWINLDYVIRIDRGLDPQEPTMVRLVGNERITLSRAEGDKLVGQLNQCCEGNRRTASSNKSGSRRERARVKRVRRRRSEAPG